MTEKRRITGMLLTGAVYLAAALCLAVLVGIIGYVVIKGLPAISWKLITGVPSVTKGTQGILPFLLNTLYMILLTLLIVLPIGVGAAVYLNEYASNKKLIRVIEFTTETLAGIPSILYGLVGYLVFCQKLGLQTSLLSGCLTLTIMTLPTIIRTTQESLKTVPISYREGALGLGATKWHIVRTIVLPCSLDGIVTGCILAAGRVVGESAALLFTAGAGKLVAKSLLAAYSRSGASLAVAKSLLAAYSRSGASLAVALYLYVFEEGNFQVGYAIALVLLVLVTAINLAAKWARKALKQKT